MQFDHIGVATRDADAAADRFELLLDAPVVHEEASDEMRFVFLALEDGYFELLEPLEGEEFIAPYIEREGPGTHHVAVHVDDIDAAIETALEAGIEMIDEEPRPGAWGHEIAFVHPSEAGGVLLEYVA